MAIDNMISISFTNEELNTIDKALTDLETIVSHKFISLTPDERRSHARVGKETEDWIGKVKDYMGQNPELVLRHIDTTEYNADFEARKTLIPRLRRIEAIYNLFEDTNMLIGSDLYHNAITYYKGLKAAAATDAAGAKTIYADLSARFPGRPKAVKDTTAK